MSLNGGLPAEQLSYLAVDIGTATTSAALFDVVEGEYCLIAAADAPTTVDAPHHDLLIGVRETVSRLTSITRRRLLAESGELIVRSGAGQGAGGAGVDRLVVTGSAAAPLAVTVVALLEEVSLVSARRALRATYTRQLPHISLTDGRSDQEREKLLVEQQPELILITGGVDGGAEEPLLHMIEITRSALGEQPDSSRADVLYAGNSHLWEKLLVQLEDRATVIVAENVRPTMDEEHLADAVRLLGEQYRARKIASLPGMKNLTDWSTYPPIATTRAFADMIGYLAALRGQTVMGVDVGAGSISLVTADRKQVKPAVNCDLGMGEALSRLNTEEYVSGIMSWAPEEVTAEDVGDFLNSRQPRAQAAMSEQDQRVELAVIRYVMRLALTTAAEEAGWPRPGASMSPIDLLVLRGKSLTHRKQAVQALSALLDALQPAGIFQVVADRYNVLPGLGAIAPLQPLAPMQVLAGGALLELGWVIAPAGRLPAGKVALEITLTSESVGKLKIEVEGGAMEVLPLPPGAQAELRILPRGAVDLGSGPGAERVVMISGGRVGLVVDARGRPLPESSALPADQRLALLESWRQQLGA